MSQIDQATGNKAKQRASVALLLLIALIIGIWLLNPADIYLWLKALHVVAVISWMAGLVYLPRLFVYHTDAEIGSVQSETFKVMEYRLLKVIMGPAMMISWILGLWLAWYASYFGEIWFILKLVGVIGLTATHIFFAKGVKAFAADKNEKTASQWRMINEIPTVLMIFIVVTVIVKPF